MKKILSILPILFFALSVFGQYQQNIAINPNQSPSKQYIAIALGGKQLLSNQKLKNTPYDYKGNYSSVYLPDFVAAIATELNEDIAEMISDSLGTVVTIDDVRDEISDSLATVDGFWSTQTATEPALHDASGNNLSLTNLGDFAITYGELGVTEYGTIMAGGGSDGIDITAYSAGVSGSRLFLNNGVVSLTSGTTMTISGQTVTISTSNLVLNVPTYDNDAAAAGGGLTQGKVYQTSTGELRIKL